MTEYGIPISVTRLMHTNRECVYPDLSNLFVIEDVTDQVNQLMDDIPNNIETFETILDGDVEPNVSIGEQCDKPQRFPFKEFCWEFVPDDFPLTENQPAYVSKENGNSHLGIFFACVRRTIFIADRYLGVSKLVTNMRRTVINGFQRMMWILYSVLEDQPEIDNEAIRHLLSELEYPIHFFDFETYNPAIPRFEGLSPYQHFPFQYSCHILQSDGSLTHHEYLHTGTTDPRLPLVESLLDHISDVGSVVVYYAPFERQILKDLAEFFPEHSEALQSIISRLWDQLVIFRNHYRHPGFGGSNSLKNVLPILMPSLSYENLDIQEGNDAQAVWDVMIRTTSEEVRNGMINNLKEYCERDTLATVEIHKVLLRQVDEL